MWEGKVVAIHIAPAAEAPMMSVEEVKAIAGKGLEGDRYFDASGTFSKKTDPSREVTLVESEAIKALRDDYEIGIDLKDTRRNIVTEGVALNHLVGRDFSIGGVTLKGLRLCEPCGHLERLSRPGVKSGLVHRGGLRAQILADGVIRRGDAVRPAP